MMKCPSSKESTFLVLTVVAIVSLAGRSEARQMQWAPRLGTTTATSFQPQPGVVLATWNSVPRGGADVVADTTLKTAAAAATKNASSSSSATPLAKAVTNIFVEALVGLNKYIKGPKSDTLLLLATTALIYPLCQALKASPILGLLTTGLLCGPNGANLIQDVHGTELLADLGVVFFLFEMGIHLSFQTLLEMRTDVFGLGLSQFVVTALAVGGIATSVGGLSPAAAVVLGGGLALSSSAFVLQLLKDKDEMGTKFGRSSFGVLLLQDLMVVPLLVVTPLLAGDGGGLGAALGSAGIRVGMALAAIAVVGKFLLGPLFDVVASSQSQEAFVGLILCTVLGMSFLTEGLGLSNTLGAFLAGVLVSESKHRHQIEKEFSPFRGILVGLFFFTVGFEIDIGLITSKTLTVASIVLGIVALKASITAALCLVFGKDASLAQRAGLILGQGGEFGFVAFRLARNLGILDEDTTRLMLTCVSLTMAITPFLDEVGSKVAKQLDERTASPEIEIEFVPDKKYA